MKTHIRLVGTSPEQFRKCVERNAFPHYLNLEQDFGALVNAGGILRISRSGEMGYAIDCEGELTCLFNNNPGKGKGVALIRHAIHHGAISLNCFAGHLVTLYGKAGFYVHRLEAWDESKAPKGWPESLGTPDVVHMVCI
jgi:hypothetical protein